MRVLGPGFFMFFQSPGKKGGGHNIHEKNIRREDNEILEIIQIVVKAWDR